MRAVVYSRTGDTEVLRLVNRSVPAAGPGEVLVRVVVSGVNPTDWKARRGERAHEPLAFSEMVPHHDGAGTIVAVGTGVEPARDGQRVWLWEAVWRRCDGTAQEFVVLPQANAVPLPDTATFDLGACLGVPALTAHRCLTVGADTAGSLAARSLHGCNVLVAGGAGAVGHAAIELACWAGATVVATVSSSAKAALAKSAGAHHVFNYRESDPTEAIRAVCSGGVDVIVEVNPVVNSKLDQAVLAPNGTIASYASAPDTLQLDVRLAESQNARHQFVMIFSIPQGPKERAVYDVSAAVRASVLRVGADAGLPIHRFPLEKVAQAHAAVEGGAVGKVLIDVSQS
jgi:NADPH2:quinone reductase